MTFSQIFVIYNTGASLDIRALIFVEGARAFFFHLPLLGRMSKKLFPGSPAKDVINSLRSSILQSQSLSSLLQKSIAFANESLKEGKIFATSKILVILSCFARWCLMLDDAWCLMPDEENLVLSTKRLFPMPVYSFWWPIGNGIHNDSVICAAFCVRDRERERER